VRLLFGTLLALIIAACIGLGATWVAITQGTAYGGVSIGAWTAWPRVGTPGIDPYARAMVARSGELPIGSGDGVAFYARSDDEGRPLDGRCDIALDGITPQARYFTVTLYDLEGRLVANAVLADTSILRKLGGWFGQVHGFIEANSQLDALDDRMKSLNRALHNLLHVPWPESDRIILTGYPPMALLDDGKTVCPDGQAGMNVMSEFSLSEEKARDGNVAAERLNTIMQDASRQHLWSFVDSHRAAFRGRGLCASYSDAPWTMADELRVPRKINGKWEPFNPSEWRAYAPRQRLFRTPNDAYMTGNFHVAQSLMQKALNNQGYGWVQLLLAAVYSGAFHPSAEGHAVIADAVVAKSRAVIAKYEKRSNRAPAAVNLGLVDEPEGRP